MFSLRIVSRLAIVAALVLAFAFISTVRASSPFDQVNHVIVIYQENWSFDGLYGKFPGANGIANAGEAVNQFDKKGEAYTSLPQPIDTTQKPPAPDARFPADLPVAPFDTSQFIPADQKTSDLIHRFYQEQYQIDG